MAHSFFQSLIQIIRSFISFTLSLQFISFTLSLHHLFIHPLIHLCAYQSPTIALSLSFTS